MRDALRLVVRPTLVVAVEIRADSSHMTGAAYRDEEAALIEQRTLLLVARRADEARGAGRARVGAIRVSRVLWGGVGVFAMLLVLVLDLLGPEPMATPAGVTVLGHALLLTPIVSLLVLPLHRTFARGPRPFATTGDVRADIDRLRTPLAVPTLPGGAAIVPVSFALPLGVLALWPPLFAMHASLDLVRAPLRYYEMMPGLVERRMGEDEALAELLTGGAMLTLFSGIAYAIAIERAVRRQRLAGDTPGVVARAFGGVFFGTMLGQLCAARMEESAGSVALGYACLALGALVGIFGWRALFAVAARVREREQREEA